MRKFKRLMAAVLTAAMLATFLPAGVLAAEGDEPISPDSETVTSVDQTNELISPDSETVTSTDQTVDLEESQNEGEPEVPPVMDDLYVTVSGETINLIPDESATFSIHPLESQNYSLYISGYLPEELKSVDVSYILAQLKAQNSGKPDVPQAVNEVAAYSKDGGDSYIVIEDGTIDLSDAKHGYVELIIGTKDQLDDSNIRCFIFLSINIDSISNYLEAQVYSIANPRQEIVIHDQYAYEPYGYDYVQFMLTVDPKNWGRGDLANLGLKMTDEYASRNYTGKVYKGHYATANDIANGNAVDITNQIWNQNDLANSGGYQADYSEGVEVTLLVEHNGKPALIQPVELYMVPGGPSVSLASSLYGQSGSSVTNTYSPTTSDGVSYRTYRLQSGYEASGTYYVRMSYSNSDTASPNYTDYVKATYVGKLETMADAESKEDIASSIFGTPGYAVDFSQYPDGVIFTVVDKDDGLHYLGAKVEQQGVSVTLRSQYLYKQTETGFDAATDYYWSYNDHYPVSSENRDLYNFGLIYGNKKDGTYYVRMDCRNQATQSTTLDNIKGAYVSASKLTKPQIDRLPADANIKEALFGTDGAPVDFSLYPNEAVITVLDANDTLHYFRLFIFEYSVSAWFDGDLYKKTEDSFKQMTSYYEDTNEAGCPYWIYWLTAEESSDGTYYAKLNYDNPDPNADPATTRGDGIAGVYVAADMLSLAETAGKENIKDAIFSTDGAPIDFSQYPDGVVITVVYEEQNYLNYYGIRLNDYRPSGDTYFQMRGALTGKEGEENTTAYKVYVLDPRHDDYYDWGYQTVFLLNEDGTPITAEKITPTFWTGKNVDAYMGEHTDIGAHIGGTLQKSGETPVTFKSGEALQYSAAAENDTNLRNYFVTFLTPQEEPTLFVNGTNDESNYNKTYNIPQRTIRLDARHDGTSHDILFANVGKTALTGLKVTLTGADGTGEAQNVELDQYWTVNNSTLAGFTSVNKGALPDGGTDIYGELANIGKIRLVPKKDENGNPIAGLVSGRLKIEADGVDPVEILLTGTAGDFQINTTKLLDAVKYVSYSCLVQTNYITETGANTSAVSFSISGNVPAGIRLKPNGELYGVPTADPDDYEFTVTARCTIDGVSKEDSKTYTIKVEDNENMPVWWYDQEIFGNTDYTPRIAIPNQNMDYTNIDQDAIYGNNFWSEEDRMPDWMILETQPAGNYANFIDRVFIDGVPLTPGVDYTSEEGSIKLTIRTQTLRSFGNGKHTISAESRIGDKDNGTLRRTAQNYTLTSLGGGSRPGASSGSSSSSSSSSSDRNSGTASSSFAINVADVVNGSASPSVSSAKSGTKVTVTISPDAGYAPTGLTVTRSNGRTVSTVKVSDTEYTFIMPVGAVTVTPSFQQIFVPVVGSFTDVRENDWFREAVEYVFDRDLMVGTSGNTFNPDGTVSRSMLVTVLYSLEGKPAVSDVSPFTDVQAGQWFAAPVIWAAENNLVAGLGDGTFGADASLTREQAAVILYSYAKLKGYDVEPSSDLAQFADTGSISSFALPALQWANAAGLINGYSQDTLAPGGTTTRAQLAAILRSFCENIIK
ncbi:S-layer homology domain-containing protein [Pseudoflavonifractor sp. 60]|uniref:S-layer homology domain-containing protein n=1 Tax=Pseudoflavonifractor sp. 60 TaxID=2304576 RepID=UPI001369EA35|nr:S-layer homology domain-containing protein [Pseudoflavonifractor sp. 60]NBI65401.1 S-layer homology domain-containing protein [Pseudoflavonifractor sp. 60]